jgi:hypothetical protein
MKKLIPLLILFAACTKKDTIVPQKNYTFSIDSVLTQTGTKSLAIDTNGFYHLKLIPNSNQQPYRVTGRILVNGKEPIPAENIEWESNLYWWIRKGDTSAYITKSYINYYTGQYTIIKLPPMIVSKDELVPTINKSSYSGTNGEINTIIAPISEMKRDTMIIKATHSLSNKIIYTKIVLE